MANQIDLPSNMGQTTQTNSSSKEIQEPRMKGKTKAAILMLVMGQERAANIFRELPEYEVVEISKEMSTLGRVDAEIVEDVCDEFTSKVASGDGLVGNYDTTEEYLKRALPADQVELIMENIRGPSGRSVWAKMGNMSEEALANYLKNEQPQTVAVILSYISPAHVAKVLSLFDEDFAIEVVMRILHMGPVSKDVLESLEDTLRAELISTFGRSQKKDSYAFIAEVYNNLDRKREASLTELLGQRDENDMEKVNKLKFTFEDIKRLSREDMMVVMTSINSDADVKAGLPMALKAANKEIREIFFGCMSKRAAGILMDDVNNLGAIKVKDAEAAQMAIINLIKEMGKDGEIDISPSSGEDDVIE